MLFVGKVDPQDSFILYNGSNLVLVKSVRRIQQIGVDTWHSMSTSSALHVTTRVAFNNVPTKGRRDAISASFKQP